MTFSSNEYNIRFSSRGGSCGDWLYRHGSRLILRSKSGDIQNMESCSWYSPPRYYYDDGILYRATGSNYEDTDISDKTTDSESHYNYTYK